LDEKSIPPIGGKSNLHVRRNEMKVEGAMKQIKDRFMALK
jgi:hypothetical protein